EKLVFLVKKQYEKAQPQQFCWGWGLLLKTCCYFLIFETMLTSPSTLIAKINFSLAEFMETK
ncbi:hypothetical protein ACI4B7_25960, partial [Klebsiella pneumoniae]|uniref:hypothetical protein n=1 Tax=Klebsiella pneumoniae TaxID=573 RepID=UPI0038521F0C